ncbi:MAG TPA: GNAT family N-acetyltransferase [Thermoplasmata archaeon]|nr:GNAT family N-acetyltransferase [Thermoplasmata archaeon]
MPSRPSRATHDPRVARVRLPLRTRRLDLVRPSGRWGSQAIGLLNDFEVSRWLLHVPHPYGRSDLKDFLRMVRESLPNDPHLRLWLVERRTGRLVGGMGLHRIDPVHRRAELGYWIGRPYWRRGFGFEAGTAVVRLAFNTLGLHRLEAATFDGNRPSQRLLRKLGFRFEGVRPDSFYLHGRWVADVQFGRVNRGERRRGRGPRGRPSRGGSRGAAGARGD